MITPIQNPDEGKIKAILNGGKNELDCAIVPFTFGFDNDIVDRKPTHVLIIDRTQEQAEAEALGNDVRNGTIRGRRYFVDLSKPGDFFIEFFKSGNHNLLFVFYDLSRLNKKSVSIQEDSFLEKSKYTKHFYSQEIRSYHLTDKRNGIVAFFEKDVYIPTEFFSQAPTGLISKAFYGWVNMWRREKPIDDCDYRDRVWRALTYELVPRLLYLLVAVILYFVVRAIWAAFVSVFMIAAKLAMFFVGFQNKFFTAGFKNLWTEFVPGKNKNFFDPLEEFYLTDRVINYEKKSSYHDFKEIRIGEKFVAYLPVSLAGIVTILLLGSVLINFLSNPTIHVVGILFTLSLLIAQICFIVETSNVVKKLRDKKLFDLRYKLGSERGAPTYDQFMKLSFFAICSLLVVIVVYQLCAWHFPQAIFSALTSKIGLLITAIMMFAFTIVRYGKSLAKSGGKFIWKFLGMIFKPLGKIIEALYVKTEKKLSDYLNKRFPVTPISKENLSTGDTYKDYLKSSYNFDTLPSTITASTLPKAQNTKDRVIQTFKVKFWDTKAKICKPYEL